MNTIYQNSFVYIANRYEEWQGGRCISSGMISTVITAEVEENKIFFDLSDIGNLKILPSFDFEILDTNFCILPDRIQYIHSTSDYNPVTPIICHLFYTNNNIDYVRFAMTNPDRIIEFYGYVEKMGQPIRNIRRSLQNNQTAHFILDELKSYNMLNTNALMERAINLYNQNSNLRNIDECRFIIEAFKLFVEAYKLDEKESERKESKCSLWKPKILMFISLCNYKIGNFNQSYGIAKQGLHFIKVAIDNCVLIRGIKEKDLGSERFEEVIKIIEEKYFDQVIDKDAPWNLDPTDINTEKIEKFIS